MFSRLRKVGLLGLCWALGSVAAASLTVDFEGVSDLAAANSLFTGQGITFSGGVVIVSGAFGGSLNETEFPPRSGIGVFLNDANITTILFSTPIAAFEAFFTYGGPLTLNFYDASNALMTSILSAYSANLALSGDIGSLPNEQLIAAVLSDAVRLDILIANADFTMDDLTISTADLVAVPEPSTMATVGWLGVAGWAWRWKRSRRERN